MAEDYERARLPASIQKNFKMKLPYNIFMRAR